MNTSMAEHPELVTLNAAFFQVPVRTIPLEAFNISVFLAEITPEIADVFLERKNINRSFRLPQLNRLKRAIEQERWEVNGETIIFDQDGRLIEGQHRLKAVSETRQTIWALIVHGIDRERFKTMGQGAKRTAGDILGIQGVKNSRSIAAALRWVYRYENDLMANANPNITDDELADTLPDHLAIIDSLPFGIKCHSIAAPGMVTALHYLCRKRDVAMANHFYWSLATGEQMERGDPILILRERIRPKVQKQARSILRDEEKAPIIANTWNLVRKEPGVRIHDARRIAWHPKEGQKFPKLL